MSSLKLSNDSGIYMITCTANGKIYIGSAVNLRRRWNEHQRNLHKGNHCNVYLQRAWGKYGEEAFIITVLEKCDLDSLIEREQFYLDQWQPFRERGFNIALNARAPMQGRKLTPEHGAKISAIHKGRKRSPETRAKISAANSNMGTETRAKMSDYAKNRSPEHRAALSASNKGKKLSPETRAKISAAQIGKPGKPLSPESREKIRIKATGRKMSPESIAKSSAANRGRKQTPEHIAKCAAARMGHECSPETRAKISAGNKGKKRTPEVNAKHSQIHSKYTYTVINPEGDQFECKSLRWFCKERNLSFGAMYKVVIGVSKQHKSWTVRRIESSDNNETSHHQTTRLD